MRRLGLTTAGESHGPGLTAVLSGVPSGLEIDLDRLRDDMRRRMHGYGRGARMQIEADEVEIRGGVRDGRTLGSPIALWIENRDFANWQAVHVTPRTTRRNRFERKIMSCPQER